MKKVSFPKLRPLVESQSLPLSSEQRYEFKMTADWGSPSLGRSWLRVHPEGFRIANPPRQVNNLYLDTADLQSYLENRSGVSDRMKIRLRWYGQPEQNLIVNPVLEIKIKHNLLGDKWRQELPCELDFNQSFRSILKVVQNGTAERWRALLHSFVQPTIINSYWREYYVSPDGALRATLDYGQNSYNQRFSVRPNLTRASPQETIFLIEVKAQPQYQERLEQAMSFFPIQRSRNSKYINGLSGGPF